jgi:hypothetical protein
MSVARGVLFAALICVACSGGGDDGPAPPTTGSIHFVNGTSYTIHETYVSPSTSPDWGPIQNETPIPSSGSFTLNDIPPGDYDAMGVSHGSLSTYYAAEFGFPVAAGQVVELVAVDSDFTGSVIVTNADPVYSLTGFYISPWWEPTWGPNQLVSALAPFGTFHLTGVPPDTYDFRCALSTGASHTLRYDVSSFGVSYVTCF